MGTSTGAELTLYVNLAKVAPNDTLISPDSLDRLIAHEMMHGVQFTEMSTFLTGGMDLNETWVAEGLAMLIQGGNDFLTALGNNSDATIGDAWGGNTLDYAEAYLAMRSLHEITDGGISAFIERLELGDTLDQAINATVQDNSGEVDPGADFTTFNQFVTWFNTSGAVDTYLDTADEFINGTGAVDSGNVQGSDSNLSSANTVPNLSQTALLNSHYTMNFTGSTAGLSEGLEIQIGANSKQTIKITPINLKPTVLNIAGLDLRSISTASAAISKVDSAINAVSEARSYFGAMQNRIEHTILNLDNTSENLQSAESRIRDLDMAKEMMSFTKNNILSQAAQAMLAQANNFPQGILQLLR